VVLLPGTCLALFVGQAVLYNGLVFNLGTLLTTVYGVSAAAVPLFIIIRSAICWVCSRWDAV
jgi:hypothetical protein